MYKFNIGDFVRVTKPEDTNEHPGWAAMMNKYDGIVCKVSNRYRTDGLREYEVDDCMYSFSEKWLEKITCGGDCTNCSDKICDY